MNGMKAALLIPAAGLVFAFELVGSISNFTARVVNGVEVPVAPALHCQRRYGQPRGRCPTEPA